LEDAVMKYNRRKISVFKTTLFSFDYMKVRAFISQIVVVVSSVVLGDNVVNLSYSFRREVIMNILFFPLFLSYNDKEKGFFPIRGGVL
jgi:hypothetical protein